MEMRFRIFGKKIETKDGKVFTAYSTITSNGQYMKVKFTKDCENTPKKTGYLMLTTDSDCVSRQKGKDYTNKKQEVKKEPDILWINDVIKCEKDDKYELELKRQRSEEIEKLFNDIV